jgi:putative lipoprotein
MTESDGAVLTVKLVDVSRADAVAEVLAVQEIAVDGPSARFPFELDYEPNKIIASNSYAVQARVEADGVLLAISDTVIPVITMGAPTSEVEIPIVLVNSP